LAILVGAAPTPVPMTRVLIADDHPIVRTGLKGILGQQHDMAVLGEAATGAEVCRMVVQKPWDVVILDVSLPDRNGLEVLKDIKRQRPKIPVLVLVAHHDEQFAVRAIRAGAAGYLTKSAEPEEVINAVRRLAQGKRYLNPAVAEELIQTLGHKSDEAPHQRLSDREFQVLCLLGSGKSVRQIADELGRDIKTIGTHRARILEKLNLQSTAQLVRYVLERQLANLE
jgi:DNA-binding NarL/FixJ family response regulator